MAIQWVQANHVGGGSAATRACPFTSGNTAANFLVATVGVFNGGGVTAPAKYTVTDSAGNIWKRANPACGKNASGTTLFQFEIWYVENCLAGANTVTAHSTPDTTMDVVVREFSGIALTASLDQAAFNTYIGTGAGTVASVGPVTTGFADELIISFFSNATTNGLTLTAGSGYTLDYTNNGNYGYEYKIVAAGAYSGGGGYSASVPWCATIVTFKGTQTAPVISDLSFQKTDTTIVATWTTDLPSDSNFSVGGKAAIDNGFQTQVTSHQAIVTGLIPSTIYSCVVTSGGVSSTPQNVTTNAAQSRTAILSAANSSPVSASTHGDTVYNFVSNDNVTYNVMDDSKGWGDSLGAYIHAQLDSLSNESTFTGPIVNQFTSIVTGTNYFSGLFGMGGSLYGFMTPVTGSTPQIQKYGHIMKSPDHGATWNNWLCPLVFSASGIQPNQNMGQYGNVNFGWTVPVRYAKDDGTLGYLTAGNRIDGADGFVYIVVCDGNEQNGSHLYLARIPRAALTYLSSYFEYWKGPASPTPADFVNDSNWQSGVTGLTSIYSATSQISAPDMVFIPVINRYLLLTHYYPDMPTGSWTNHTVWVFLEAPTPAGPWTQVYTQNNTPTGYYSAYPLHRTVAENALANSIPLTLTYTSDYTGAYLLNHSILTLTTSIHAVSGGAGVAGATISYVGPTSGSVTADGSGNYSIPSLIDGAYIITPSKTGYTFSPASSNQTLSGANITGVNFTAEPTVLPDDPTVLFLGSVTETADSGLGAQYIGRVRVVSSPRTGDPNPYLGKVYKVSGAPAGLTDPLLGEVIIVTEAPSNDSDPYLGQFTEL